MGLFMGKRLNMIPSWHQIPQEVIDIIKEKDPSLMIEVGSWKGYSADLWLQNTNAFLYCVDTWLGALEFMDSTDPVADLKLFEGYPTVYWDFRENMKRWDGRYRAIPQTSLIAARYFSSKNIEADCIYIDASHEYEDVKTDITVYAPLLNKNGFLFGDDYAYEWPGVVRAVNEYCVENLLQLTVVDRYWFLRGF